MASRNAPFATDDGIFCDFPHKQKAHTAPPSHDALGQGLAVVEPQVARAGRGAAVPSAGAPYGNASRLGLVAANEGRAGVADDRWQSSYQAACAGEIGAQREERRRLRKAVTPAYEQTGAGAREAGVENYAAGPRGSGYFGKRPVDMRFETRDLQKGTSVSMDAAHIPGYQGHVPKQPAQLAGAAFLGQSSAARSTDKSLLMENWRTKPSGYTGHIL